MSIVFPIDFNLIRKTIANEITKVTGLIAIVAEPEQQDSRRPAKPYFDFKLTTPAAKSGDDTKSTVLDQFGEPTTFVNSGGVRKMTVEFNCFGTSHEEAYNYMGLWQTALDLANIQEDLRRAGIAVWIIGNLVDLSQLLNTAYEGRSHMECTFGIAMNLVSDLGQMDTVPIAGQVDSGKAINNIDTTVVET